jgi:5'(3')-deoxyribonucleotidase
MTFVQLFVPPISSLTKEWIRMILSGEKKLLKMSEIKPVDVGSFPELSIKAMYKEFADRDDIKPYMPPKVNKNRTVDKEYFWNVVNTIAEEEVDAMVKHAHRQRKDIG